MAYIDKYGFEVGTKYTYTIVTKNNGSKTFYSETGSFKTTDITTSIENVDSQKPHIESQKVMHNGVLYIERNGKIYNALGGKLR
ncbi:MAG: hypothetical protein MJZ92_05545 [Paludibacteraceae bacterium]|nr:hypothetical protein [Paludibacteraceae bacterium]